MTGHWSLGELLQMEGPVLGCYCTRKEKQRRDTKSPRALGTNFNIADGQGSIWQFSRRDGHHVFKGFLLPQHALITQQRNDSTDLSALMKRSLKDIYFLVCYSHFQDDLLIYSKLLIYTYHLRMCWKNMCRALFETLKDYTCSNVETGRKTCTPVCCGSYSSWRQRFCLCHVTPACPRYLSPSSLWYFPHVPLPTHPNTLTIHSASFNHNYIFKIRLEGKCFSVKYLLRQGRREFYFRLTEYFLIIVLGEITLNGRVIPLGINVLGVGGGGAWWLMELFVYPCCQKTS